MSTQALKTVAKAAADQPATDQPLTQRNFPAVLEAWLPEIKRALPKHISAERMARVALTAFRRNPKLADCDPRSVFAAVLQSAQLGLEIDVLGRAYLVPYEKREKVGNSWKTVGVECQFIPGWKGLVDLMNRSGEGTVWTGAVFQGDTFEWQLGDSPFCRHIPGGEMAPELLTHVYAVGRVKGADWPVIEVWPIEKIWKHRDRYNKVGGKHYSFTNPEMYARKVPLLQVLKYMPCSTELARAIAANDDAEIGRQNVNLTDAIQGEYTPAGASGDSGGDTEFTKADALAMVADGDFTGAQEVAKGLKPEEAAEVNAAIEAAKQAKQD